MVDFADPKWRFAERVINLDSEQEEGYMTCIAAWVNNGVITMGGDSAGVNSSQDLQLRKDTKVFRKSGLLIGVSGSWRVCQELKYKELPSLDLTMDKHEWMVLRLLPWLRENINEAELQRTELLVGLQGSLYHVYGGQQVSEEIEQYEACGCAAQIARGAFYAMREFSVDVSPDTLVTVALEAAERFCSGVRGPFTIEVLGHPSYLGVRSREDM